MIKMVQSGISLSKAKTTTIWAAEFIDNQISILISYLFVVQSDYSRIIQQTHQNPTHQILKARRSCSLST